MPRSMNVSLESAMDEKIEYLGLNFERVPKSLISTEKINFKPVKGYDEKQYKQYKFIRIKDIDILLSPTHRMDNLRDKYEKASPLYMYLDSKHPENEMKYATFLKLLKKVAIADVEKVGKEQKMLALDIPFKVKFSGNYLWQIYYSEYEDRYFMLVPTEDSDYTTFFYLLKRKIENRANDMLFAPISYLDYDGSILKKSEIREMEDYLWLFTKNYPSIYEVTDQEGKVSLQVIGETEVYGKIKTLYKNVFKTPRDASKFFKLLKALFIIQTELPRYYKFDTNIDEDGELVLNLNGEEIEYENLLEFISGEYKKAVELEKRNNEEIDIYQEKLEGIRKESTKLEKEYLEKEKMISTFLECKKSFFGKVKYFFSMGKQLKKVNTKKSRNDEDKDQDPGEIIIDNEVDIEERNYTLDELIKAYRKLEESENKNKNIVQDINAMKLKNKNLKKKIENATAYINEISKHKKSIFEFWKYSNKDEVAALDAGEEEEVNVYKIEKVFNYDTDFETFGENIDRSQRMKFTDTEFEGSYLATTNLLDIMNKILSKERIEPTIFADILKKLKDERLYQFKDDEIEEFDIFGGRTKNKERHVESHRDKYQILGIKKDTTVQDFKKALTDATKDVKRALKKNNLSEEAYVYKVSNEPVEFTGLQTFSLDEQSELHQYFTTDLERDKIYLYRLKLSRGTNFIAFSNIILYDNRNMTLPTGMQESNKILLNIDALDIKQVGVKKLTVRQMENEKDDFSELILKTLEVYELESK